MESDNQGIITTEQIIKLLGAENLVEIKNGFQFKSRGFIFSFVRTTNPQHWSFCTEQDSHYVTHLDECFGFIAQDFFKAGIEEGKREIRKALGID